MAGALLAFTFLAGAFLAVAFLAGGCLAGGKTGGGRGAWVRSMQSAMAISVGAVVLACAYQGLRSYRFLALGWLLRGFTI